MTLDEAIYKERAKAYKFKDKAWRAKSAHISEERRAEAEYHEQIMRWLMELKEARQDRW